MIHRCERSRHSVQIALTAAVLSVMLSTACHSDSQPMPSPSDVNASVSGTWRGAASDSTGPGPLIWRLAQNGTSFTGTVTIVDSATNVSGRGSISGTVSGTTLHFSMSIPSGGFDQPYDGCAAQVSGDAQVSGASLAGSYSGLNSCTGIVTAGQIKMTRP